MCWRPIVVSACSNEVYSKVASKHVCDSHDFCASRARIVHVALLLQYSAYQALSTQEIMVSCVWVLLAHVLHSLHSYTLCSLRHNTRSEVC